MTRLSMDMQRLLYEGIEKIVEENKDCPKRAANEIVKFIDEHFWIE